MSRSEREVSLNFVAHISAGARRLRNTRSDGFLAGCALPDFAAMARLRLSRSGGDVGLGIAFHQNCDSAFHGLPWFRDHCQDLYTLLRDNGLQKGPARACSHAGVELLIDGALMSEHETQIAVRRVLRFISVCPAEIVDTVPVDSKERWQAHLEDLGGSFDPARYQDPAFAASRLMRATAERPALSFDESHVDAVAAALAMISVRVTNGANTVVHQVLDACDTNGR